MRDERSRSVGVDVLQDFMSSENELLRCAALQAYVAQQKDLDAVRGALLEALMDPDPDMRADAMEALADIATAEDLPAIRRSLAGDPVREVKQAAVRAMGRIGTDADVALLLALVLSRCEETIAWEDALGDWEEWLDIQVAAIAALGQLGAVDSIEDLFEARDDPQGQNLDTPVFDALGQMGSVGVSWLLAVVKTGSGLAPKRAADALARLAPDTLADHIETLLDQPDAALRIHAVTAMSSGDSRLTALVSSDPEAEVRAAALRKASALHPHLALLGLKDREATVQATALDALALPLAIEDAQAVADNICLWATRAKPVLLTAAVRNLPRFAPDRAQALLADLARDAAKPLEARVTAVRTLADMQPAVEVSQFTALLRNPAQQVRLAAVLALRDRMDDPTAQEAVAAAASQSLLSEEDAVQVREADGDGPEVSAPKEGGLGQTQVRITPDGEIVKADGSPVKGASTLSSILADSVEAPQAASLAEDTPEESAPKRKKRRAVEGPDEIAKFLALDVLRSCAETAGSALDQAITDQLCNEDEDIRATAWKAASQRAATLGNTRAGFCEAARAALTDPDPQTRFHAFDVLLFGKDDEDVREMALACPDGLTRAAAIAHLPADQALGYIADPAEAVRKASVSAILVTDCPDHIATAIDALLQAKWIDTLSQLLVGSKLARDKVVAMLAEGAASEQKAYMILRGLAGAPI